jgi:hypothetical protein
MDCMVVPSCKFLLWIIIWPLVAMHLQVLSNYGWKKIMYTYNYIWCLSFLSSISFTLIPTIIPHIFRCAIYHVRNMIEPTSKSLAPWKASCQLIGPSFKQFAKGTSHIWQQIQHPISYLPYFVLTMQIFGVEDSMHHFIQTFTNNLSCMGN